MEFSIVDKDDDFTRKRIYKTCAHSKLNVSKAAKLTVYEKLKKKAFELFSGSLEHHYIIEFDRTCTSDKALRFYILKLKNKCI